MACKIRISLEAKMCMLMVGTLFLVVLGVGHVAMNEYRTALIDEKTEAFGVLAHSLSLSSKQLLAGDDHVLKGVSARPSSSISELAYIVITDGNGRALFQGSRNPQIAKRVDKTGWSLAARRVLGYQSITQGDIQNITVPIVLANGQRGSFIAGFSLSQVRQTLDRVQSAVLSCMIFGLIVGVVASMVWGRRMSKGLRSLMEASKAVSSGNLSYRIANKAKDEIGQLADIFNYMVETLDANQQQLIERANTDCATGLYNHRYFQERLQAEVIRSCRYNRDLSLLMMDIDFFKNFNDDQGHPAGDSALRDIAQLIMGHVRLTDVAVRYGGEEFAVILPETDVDEATIIAERIRQAVESHIFHGRDNKDQSLTLSIGMAQCPSQAQERKELILAADIAMYQAKEFGRNRICSYDASSHPGVIETDTHKLYVLLSAHDLTTIESLAEAVDAKLKLPEGHSRAVARVAAETAQKLGLSDAECSSIYLAALLRDIGQIVVPDSTLGKPGALTPEEKATVSKHPSLGYAIIQKAPHLSMILPALLHHHEWYDGTGYPANAVGEEIPISARIISASDAYHSMTIKRPYRKQKTANQAQRELVEKSSTQFDPEVVRAMLKVLESQQDDQQAA